MCEMLARMLVYARWQNKHRECENLRLSSSWKGFLFLKTQILEKFYQVHQMFPLCTHALKHKNVQGFQWIQNLPTNRDPCKSVTSCKKLGCACVHAHAHARAPLVTIKTEALPPLGSCTFDNACQNLCTCPKEAFFEFGTPCANLWCSECLPNCEFNHPCMSLLPGPRCTEMHTHIGRDTTKCQHTLSEISDTFVETQNHQTHCRVMSRDVSCSMSTPI